MDLRFRRFAPAVALLGLAWGCGSGGSSSDQQHTADAGPGGTTTTAACVTIGAPATPALPHVEASGSEAHAVLQAVDAILAAQTPAIAAGAKGYVLPSLTCLDLSSPDPTAPSGFGCTFAIEIDGGPAVPVTVSRPSTLAQNLSTAFVAAGALPCTDDPHGPSITLANVTATIASPSLAFDDGSSYAPPPTPNFVTHTADAEAVIAAFVAAGISDCDPTRNVFLECNTLAGAPSCGYQWTLLDKVGSSELVYSCGPGSAPEDQGGVLDAAASLSVWQSILAAATNAAFKPLDGTVSQATVVNASYFTWDGTSLGFTLTIDDTTPPPPAPTPGM